MLAFAQDCVLHNVEIEMLAGSVNSRLANRLYSSTDIALPTLNLLRLCFTRLPYFWSSHAFNPSAVIKIMYIYYFRSIPNYKVLMSRLNGNWTSQQAQHWSISMRKFKVLIISLGCDSWELSVTLGKLLHSRHIAVQCTYTQLAVNLLSKYVIRALL